MADSNTGEKRPDCADAKDVAGAGKGEEEAAPPVESSRPVQHPLVHFVINRVPGPTNTPQANNTYDEIMTLKTNPLLRNALIRLADNENRSEKDLIASKKDDKPVEKQPEAPFPFGNFTRTYVPGKYEEEDEKKPQDRSWWLEEDLPKKEEEKGLPTTALQNDDAYEDNAIDDNDDVVERPNTVSCLAAAGEWFTWVKSMMGSRESCFPVERRNASYDPDHKHWFSDIAQPAAPLQLETANDPNPEANQDKPKELKQEAAAPSSQEQEEHLPKDPKLADHKEDALPSSQEQDHQTKESNIADHKQM